LDQNDAAWTKKAVHGVDLSAAWMSQLRSVQGHTVSNSLPFGDDSMKHWRDCFLFCFGKGDEPLPQVLGSKLIHIQKPIH
jgi:hypothetical protein